MKEAAKHHPKTKRGTVVSNKMDKTVVVKVERKYRHPKYGKVIIRGKRYYAHSGDRELNMGDVVTIRETRPLSKQKRWLVINAEAAQ